MTSHEDHCFELHLLRSFELRRRGKQIPVPGPSQRLLACVALGHRAVPRSRAAGTLWPEATEERARSNLRSAVWRLGEIGKEILPAESGGLTLAMGVRVDIADAEMHARRLVSSDGVANASAIEDPLHLLSSDLLPDWSEDWVAVERERFRQLRLHALESLCHRLTDLGRFAEATQAAFAAIAGEPLRESAHRCLISVYIAEGNAAEAIRQFDRYNALLQNEMGLAPSARLRQLIGVAAG